MFLQNNQADLQSQPSAAAKGDSAEGEEVRPERHEVPKRRAPPAAFQVSIPLEPQTTKASVPKSAADAAVNTYKFLP